MRNSDLLHWAHNIHVSQFLLYLWFQQKMGKVYKWILSLLSNESNFTGPRPLLYYLKNRVKNSGKDLLHSTAAMHLNCACTASVAAMCPSNANCPGWRLPGVPQLYSTVWASWNLGMEVKTGSMSRRRNAVCPDLVDEKLFQTPWFAFSINLQC